MVVESLRHQRQRQRVAAAARLLQLGALVLEPDLDLRVGEVKVGGELRATLFRQVAIVVELALESRQLLVGERDARALFGGRRLLLTLRLPAHLARAWACKWHTHDVTIAGLTAMGTT